MKQIALLIVDDEDFILEMVKTHFEKEDYAVFTAKNGQEALDILDYNKIHIVITDLEMPVMDGRELLEQIRKKHPIIKSIIMTGCLDQGEAINGIANGAFGFVSKPIDFPQLSHLTALAVLVIQYWMDQLLELSKLRHGSDSKKSSTK